MEVALIDVAGAGSGSLSFVWACWNISDNFLRASIWRAGISLYRFAMAFMAFVKSWAMRCAVSKGFSMGILQCCGNRLYFPEILSFPVFGI